MRARDAVDSAEPANKGGFCVYASRLAVPLKRVLYGTKVQL